MKPRQSGYTPGSDKTFDEKSYPGVIEHGCKGCRDTGGMLTSEGKSNQPAPRVGGPGSQMPAGPSLVAEGNAKGVLPMGVPVDGKMSGPTPQPMGPAFSGGGYYPPPQPKGPAMPGGPASRPTKQPKGDSLAGGDSYPTPQPSPYTE